MRRKFPPAPDLGPCPQEYQPVDVDDEGTETKADAEPGACPGRMRQLLNADAGTCDACFFMIPQLKKRAKPAGRLIEAPGRFRVKP